ncbi:MAG: DUF1015 family protein [Myxococcota bacterium]
MASVRPFRALRPRDDLARQVIAPPYDVLTEVEARAIARERNSFVRVTRSEVDLPPGTDPHAEVAYTTARANLDAFVAAGVLVEDREPTYYFYGQVMGSHEQVGILAGCSVDEYDDGRIAKHEFTRPDKEDDRTHHMDVLDAQVGLVFLAYRPTAELDRLTTEVTRGRPAWEVTTEDGVIHRLWVAPASAIEPIRAAFAQVPRLYIADGHHRSAAASRIHAQRRSASSAEFLAGLYPSDRLQVLAYNRVVHDLNGLDPAAFRTRLAAAYELVDDGASRPARRGEIAMYLDGRWTRLVARPAVRSSDPVAGLDVSILQDHVLGPILGIDDPRRSERITFVGGIRGEGALKSAVDGGRAVAFHLFPTSLDELFAVADAGMVMPPKSTWFEPKLREGVVVRRLG